jgi:hypothetical protein
MVHLSATEFNHSSRSTNNVRFGWNAVSVHDSYCNCECWACYYYIYYANKSGSTFFRDLTQQHYNQLNRHVFQLLNDLRPQFEERHPENRQSLARLLITVPNTSIFYTDARRHMTQQIRTNIDNLLEQLRQYNGQVDLINPNLAEIIDNIMNAAMSGPIE